MDSILLSGIKNLSSWLPAEINCKLSMIFIKVLNLHNLWVSWAKFHVTWFFAICIYIIFNALTSFKKIISWKNTCLQGWKILNYQAGLVVLWHNNYFPRKKKTFSKLLKLVAENLFATKRLLQQRIIKFQVQPDFLNKVCQKQLFQVL